MPRKVRKFNVNKKGFTLVELVVSIAIFAVILVLMSNIVISMSKFALDNERRNDFISELDNAANIIKNDLRSAQDLDVTTCSGGGIFRTVNNSGVTEYYKLVLGNPADSTEKDRLLWLQKDSTCGNLATPNRIFLTSSVTVKLDSNNASALSIKIANDSETSGQITNSLIYIQLTACSPSSLPVGGQLFNCTLNPYKYTFAISTRNIF
jgi:prepilin-type N-terminal cleavage/methylation domain-containing protein